MRWPSRLRSFFPPPRRLSPAGVCPTTPVPDVVGEADAAGALGRLWRPPKPASGVTGLPTFTKDGLWSEWQRQRQQQHPYQNPRRWFGQPPRRGEPLSREWMAQLWVEERRRSDNRLRGRARRRKRVPGDAGEAAMDGGTGWGALVSSLRKSFLSVSNPVRRVEKEAVYGAAQPPPVSRVAGGALSPGSPEEVKLAPLLARANLVITRDIEWANVMFAFEQESRYIIMDASYPGSPVGFIREQSNVIFRQFFRSRRPFTAYIIDAWGNEIFRVRRPFWWINSTIYTEVDGKEIGVVHRRWHLWRRIYDLYLGNVQFAVVENPGFWNWTFTLKDNNENVLAEINRDWRGIGLELFTDAGQYVIRFGHTDTYMKPEAYGNIEELDISRPLSLSERAIAVALAVSLDCDYFSRSGGWGLPIIAAGE